MGKVFPEEIGLANAAVEHPSKSFILNELES